jgi:hypothetical protein
VNEAASEVLRSPRPAGLYPWLRRFSALETLVFAGLLIVWLAPGMENATTFFGWAHGIGYLTLLVFIFAAVLRHEVPFWLLISALTPVGPIGSSVGIIWLDRRRSAESGPPARTFPQAR